MSQKFISQVTFDEAVKENVTEFEMSWEEAVEDAREQFKNVDLSHLSMKPIDQRAKEPKSQVLELLAQLDKESTSKSSTPSTLVPVLNKFFDVLKENESSRALVGQKNGVEITLRNLRRLAASSSSDAKSSDEDEDEALFVASVRVLTILCSKTPKNRVKFAQFGEAASLIFERMKSKPTSSKTQVCGFNAVRVACTKNPQNTNAFAKLGILDHLLLVLKSKESSSNADVVKAIANGVWPLARGDGSIDSKAPEYQKYLAENDAVVLFLQALKQHQKNEDIVGSCCRAMEAICVNDTTCKEAEEAGGLKLLTNLIRDQKDCAKVVSKCASCLSCFARSDLNKPKIVELGVCEFLVSLMQAKTFEKSPNVHIQSMKLITAVTLRQPEICERVMKCDSHSAALGSMRLFPGNASVQREACLMLRNLVSRTKQHVKAIMQAGAEPLIRKARELHNTCEDVAFGALRELNCDISDMKHYRDQGRAMYVSFCYSLYLHSLTPFTSLYSKHQVRYVYLIDVARGVVLKYITFV